MLLLLANAAFILRSLWALLSEGLLRQITLLCCPSRKLSLNNPRSVSQFERLSNISSEPLLDGNGNPQSVPA